MNDVAAELVLTTNIEHMSGFLQGIVERKISDLEVKLKLLLTLRRFVTRAAVVLETLRFEAGAVGFTQKSGFVSIFLRQSVR